MLQHLEGAASSDRHSASPRRDERGKISACRSCAIEEIHSRGKLAIVVGGSGLYIKALTHGLAPLPESDPKLRERLNAMSLDKLHAQLAELDPETAQKIDLKNRRRVVRALEICLLVGKPASEVVAGGADPGKSVKPRPRSAPAATGVFVFRDREELYSRINQRVEAMFENGVIEEVQRRREGEFDRIADDRLSRNS